VSTERIAELLARRLGHDVSALGELIFEQTLTQARRQLNVFDNDQLMALLLSSEAAFAQLTELLVVPETWFFRMREQFDDLLRFAHACTARPIRILSLPCSTGEEVYSILMTLLDAGFSAEEIEVIGWDVSIAAVALAQRGNYSTRALRGSEPHPRWMQTSEQDRLQIHPRLCDHASFAQRNALNLAPAVEAPFQVIFCRNLLIYLQPEARTALLGNLRSMLAPGGLLLAGLAELIPGMAPGFKHWSQGSALSFTPCYDNKANLTTAAAQLTKVSERRQENAPETPQLTRPQAADFAIEQPEKRAENRLTAPASVVKMSRPDVAPVTLTHAQALADAGDLIGARAAIKLVLTSSPDSCEAQFLAGLLALSADDLEAADTAFLRAQYLQPDHLEALEYRALIAQRCGHSQAGELSLRANRLRLRLSAQK
jgi:chemotaxis protein methyltransferase WspC